MILCHQQPVTKLSLCLDHPRGLLRKMHVQNSFNGNTLRLATDMDGEDDWESEEGPGEGEDCQGDEERPRKGEKGDQM